MSARPFSLHEYDFPGRRICRRRPPIPKNSRSPGRAMRILQFIDVPWDSGLAHYALILSQELKKKGHQVFISALPGEKPWIKARRLGLKTVPLATLKRLKPLRRFLVDHDIQVLNAHTGSTHSLAVASALGRNIAVVRTRSDARHVRP